MRHEKSPEAPLGGGLTMTSYPVAINFRYLENHATQIKSYYGTRSGSHGRSFRIRHKNRLKHPVTEKSPWRHIRLAIKPRYLGNHATQIKNYYRSLSGGHARSFRIRHEKSREAPPGGGLTFTSYPVSNTTSFSRKPCMVADKLLYGSLSWSIGSLVISINNSKY